MDKVRYLTVEAIFTIASRILSISVRWIPCAGLMEVGGKSLETYQSLENQPGLLGFRLRRFALALAISRLDDAALRKYFSPGSETANLVTYLLDPAFRSIKTSATERLLVESAKRKLVKKFDATSFLVASLYAPPYEIHILGSFQKAIRQSHLAPILISYLMSTNVFYVELGEDERHLKFAERAVANIREWFLSLDGASRIQSADLLRYYVGGNFPLMSNSDQRIYCAEKNRLLRDFFAVDLPALATFPPYKPAATSTVKRVGIIRFSLVDSVEQEMVLSTTRNPPAGIEMWLFVFDADPLQIEKFGSLYPWFRNRIVELNAGDLAGSLRLIRDKRLDLLLNTSPLSGRFLNEISALLTYRGAPVQAMLVGDVVTSGIDAVDYFIIPELMSSPGMQEQFSERLATVRGLSATIVLDRQSDLSLRAMPASMGVMFGSNAHVMKLSPDVLMVWATILRKVEFSRITLMPFPGPNAMRYRRALLRSIANVCLICGISPDRFIIAEASGKNAVLGVLKTCDIYLDTFPYSGSISIFDVISTIKPMVTLKGNLFRGQLAACILELLELDNYMVAATKDDYVRLAIAQASNPELVSTLKRDIGLAIDTHPDLLDPDQSSIEFYRTVQNILLAERDAA